MAARKKCNGGENLISLRAGRLAIMAKYSANEMAGQPANARKYRNRGENGRRHAGRRRKLAIFGGGGGNQLNASVSGLAKVSAIWP